MVTIYGIPNCDKCRAAIKWFKSHGVSCDFHDLRVDGLTADLLKQWQEAASDDTLMNKRSQTWRKIGAAEREGLSRAGNRQLMLDHPTLIKRPIVVTGSTVIVGYDEPAWTATFVHGK